MEGVEAWEAGEGKKAPGAAAEEVVTGKGIESSLNKSRRTIMSAGGTIEASDEASDSRLPPIVDAAGAVSVLDP